MYQFEEKLRLFNLEENFNTTLVMNDSLNINADELHRQYTSIVIMLALVSIGFRTNGPAVANPAK